MEIEKLGLAPGVSLGVSSFVASSHPADSCGLNGLPLTPNSISVLGYGQVLKIADHPHLSRYLDIVKGKHQRIVVVSEFWRDNLAAAWKEGRLGGSFGRDQAPPDGDMLMGIAGQVLGALAYLNQMRIINLNLRPENVMLDSNGAVKLYGYGLARMTDYGRLVAFPIGDPRLTAPEVFLRGMRNDGIPMEIEADKEGGGDSVGGVGIPEESDPPDKPQADVWSLGMMLASLLLNIPQVWPQAKIGQIIRKVLSLGECGNGAAVLEKVAREHNCLGRISTIPSNILHLVHLCLEPKEDQRSTPDQLLTMNNIFNDINDDQRVSFKVPAFPSQTLRSRNLNLPIRTKKRQPLDCLTIQEIYYLWQLAGGDVFSELRKHGLMITTPPVISTPELVTGEGQEFGVPRQRAALYDSTIICLPIRQLMTCLDEVGLAALVPSISMPKGQCSSNLPLVIRERDVRYQCGRITLYRTLLQGFPFRQDNIWQESFNDVVPLYRPQIWASLLNIQFDVGSKYAEIDKDTWNPVDRQIEVDIPRCHQYNELLASDEGHRKLKRVLKAWVVNNPGLVYWQGLDSLAAPFLFLNFNNEALAWACLSAFIEKYLYNMFQKDNAAVIQEYLIKFSHLQAFHDPALFNHLDEIGFIPDLYAIPWVLTMFSHVFPLHKIFHLWDRLLLGDSSFPLCVGLAVLHQLRDQLMEAQFNECILLFSEMPSVDIELVVGQSVRLFHSTPPSLARRAEDKPQRPVSGGSDPVTPPPLTVSELKQEKVGRISGRDVLQYLRESSYASGNTAAGPLILDVRSKDEYRTGTLPGAISFPPVAMERLAGPCEDPLLSAAKERRRQVFVMGRAAERSADARAVAEWLLSAASMAYVAVIDGGVEVFRTTDVLVVPALARS